MSEIEPIAGMTHGDVLGYISEYRDRYGWPPSRRDIAQRFGVSTSSVQLIMKEMIEQGLIQVAPGGARAINITGAGMAIITEPM